MKVIHLSHSDGKVGADRSAYRIHDSLRRAGISSRMWVDRSVTDDNTVVRLNRSKSGEFISIIRNHLPDPLTSRLKTKNQVLHSPSVLPSGRVRRINQSDADIVHLHWPNAELISIEDIGRIKKPIVWTVHDMWPFCGAEHYASDFRWRDGYQKSNRPHDESGFDLNRWTWLRKQKSWKSPMNIVCPSQWMADCVNTSALMHGWPSTVVPYPINPERWQPINMQLARSMFSLPHEIPLIVFGAMRGSQDQRKGFDLLVQAVRHLANKYQLRNAELVIFGESEPTSSPKLGFPVHYVGHLHDDLSLRALYSAASVIVIPSRQDNLPNVGIEAQACGAPIASFNTCGLRDIVIHKRTGYLAEAFDSKDLANGIMYIISPENQLRLRLNAKDRSINVFCPKKVAAQYSRIYEQALNIERR